MNKVLFLSCDMGQIKRKKWSEGKNKILRHSSSAIGLPGIKSARKEKWKGQLQAVRKHLPYPEPPHEEKLWTEVMSRKAKKKKAYY